MDNLKLCPFCGKDAAAVQKATRPNGSLHSWKVWCSHCNCRTGPEKTRQAAIAAWNQRE